MMTKAKSQRSAGRSPRAGAWTAAMISPAEEPKASGVVASGNKTRLFLIRDSRSQRGDLANMLRAQNLSIIATARTGAEALRQVARLRPQLVVLDAATGKGGSLGLVTAILTSSPSTKVIVMHLKPTHPDVVEFVRAGVSGFILKEATRAEFVRTVRLVADGISVLPDSITARLFSHVASRAAGRSL